MLSVIALIVVVVGFAWNLGVHYTGAVMGMPYAARSIALWPALVLIALMTILGATFASGRVEATVGQYIINDQFVTIPDAIVIVLSAGLLTLLYNYQKIPRIRPLSAPWRELAWHADVKPCSATNCWLSCAAGSLARSLASSWPSPSNGSTASCFI